LENDAFPLLDISEDSFEASDSATINYLTITDLFTITDPTEKSL
jgi:hypothetical protein